MFLESPELYDAIYHFKNYAHECQLLRAVIAVAAPGARTILDVACGTGEHDKFLKITMQWTASISTKII